MKYFNLRNLRAGLLVVLGFLFVKPASAQQEVFYSQYMFNMMAINPAYAGSRDVLSVTALGRYQWQGVPGAPKTHSLTVDMPFQNEKMGLGLTVFNDNIGKFNTTGVNLAYAYRFKLSERTTMSLGLQPTFTSVSANLFDVETLDPNDLSFANDISRIVFNAGLGTFISNDRAYIGFSVPQMIEQRVSPNPESEGRIQRHYFIMGGFVIGSGNLKLKPSTVVRLTRGAPMGFDLNMNFWYRDRIALGVSGRKSQMVFSGKDVLDAVVGMLELQLTPQLRVGAAMDFNLGRLDADYEGKNFYKQLVSTPTYEGFLRYEFGYRKDRIITPRYF